MKFLVLTLFTTFFFQAVSAKTLTLTSYNLGLAHTFVHHAKERRPHLIEALKKTNSDVLCLQEVWTKKDRKKIIKKLKKDFPYSFYTKIKNVKSQRRPTCKIKELFGEGKFVGCMQKNCSGLKGDEFTDCIIETCGPALTALRDSNRECATSLMAQVGKSSLAGLLTVLNPLKKAGLFAFKGSNGLILLSKKPLKNKKEINFSKLSTLNKRVALSAQLEIDGVDHKLICTHLTADLSNTVPYTGTFAGWADENFSQVNELLAVKTKSNSPTYLMGDFNCSIANTSTGIDGETQKSCEAIKQAQFVDSMTSLNPSCTFCADNLLNEGETTNKILDHIYVRGATPIRAEVVFKQKIQVKKKKETILTNLSDHYGVSVEVKID